MEFACKINRMRPFKLSIHFILKLCLSYCLAVLPSANTEATTTTLQQPDEILNLVKIYNSIKGQCNDQTSDKLLFFIGNLRSINQSFTYSQHIETALHLAVKKRCYSSVRYLLENNVDTNIFNENGLTAFDLAVKDGDQTLLSLFINHLSGRELDEPLEAHPKAEVIVKDEPTAKTNDSTINESTQQRNEATDQVKKTNTKFTEIEIKVGFLMSKLSEEAQTNLTTELKGKYQLTKTITAIGSAQLFYTRVKNSDGTANTTRYVLEGTLAKKIFGEQWDGNLNIRNEKVDHVNTINISVLISKAWEMFNNKVAISVAAGPSFIHATSSTEKTINTPGILANGKIIVYLDALLPVPPKKFRVEANATYSQGAVAEAHQLSTSVSAVYQFDPELSIGVTGKRWNTMGEKGTQYIVEIQYTPKQNLF